MDQQERALAMSLFNRLERHPGVRLELSGRQAWYLLSALQLTCTHPHLGAALKSQMEGIARTIQATFDDPFVADLAERGWDRRQDAPAVDLPTPTPASDGRLAFLLTLDQAEGISAFLANRLDYEYGNSLNAPLDAYAGAHDLDAQIADYLHQQKQAEEARP